MFKQADPYPAQCKYQLVQNFGLKSQFGNTFRPFLQIIKKRRCPTMFFLPQFVPLLYGFYFRVAMRAAKKVVIERCSRRRFRGCQVDKNVGGTKQKNSISILSMMYKFCLVKLYSNEEGV
jgi:hypothetical protein